MIAEFLSDLNAKILADMKLFLDYWFLWLAAISIFIGLLWVYTRKKERHDDRE